MYALLPNPFGQKKTVHGGQKLWTVKSMGLKIIENSWQAASYSWVYLGVNFRVAVAFAYAQPSAVLCPGLGELW